jgi:hypothetical protein
MSRKFKFVASGEKINIRKEVYSMLYEKWSVILGYSFLLVALLNAILASCTRFYYKNKPVGLLSHSQLRIRQGNATFEHRLNVFGQALVFCFLTLRIYLLAFLVGCVFIGATNLATLLRN